MPLGIHPVIVLFMVESTPPSGSAASGEEELLERLRAGDEAAFETLVRTHAGRLFAVARRFLGNEPDAADALQDAFISAFKALPNFAGQARLGSWLHRIVVNASLMKLRSRRRAVERPIDDLLPAYFDDGHRIDTLPSWKESDGELLGVTEATVKTRLHRARQALRTLLERHLSKGVGGG